MLRLTEIDDLLRQLAHLSRKNLVSFADLPGFLSTELTIKLSSVSALANTVDALKDGFPLIIEPLVDYQLSTSRNLQLHLLFTLPTLDTQQAICTIEQLVPLSYQINGKCFGGSLPRHDLVLLTCDNTRYVLKQAELEQCFKGETALLCPANMLSTLENPLWLGLKWTPQTRLTFNHAHTLLPNCNTLRPLIHLGGRYYLSTTLNNILLQTNNGTTSLLLQPFHIYHFPCDVSFHQQRTGLGVCPDLIRFQFPLFHNHQFQFVPWLPLRSNDLPLYPPQNFSIPTPVHVDNSTLKSLDDTYNTLDQDLTRRLQKLNKDIKAIHPVSHAELSPVFVYFSFVLTILNLIILIVFYCRYVKRAPTLVTPPNSLELRPLTSTQGTST